jgi:hypothetical protein
MIVRVLVATAAVAALTAAPAAAATTPGAAARTTRDCLRAHGWHAALTNGGTVEARAPRTVRLPGTQPARPWYSASFFAAGPPRRVYAVEGVMYLNAGELRIAHACRGRQGRR